MQHHQLLNEQQIFVSTNDINQSTIYRLINDSETKICQFAEEY